MKKRQIRLSRRWLRRCVYVVLPILALAGLVLLGRSVTPYDADGKPMILSPSLKSTLEYQSQARRWAERLAGLDQALEALLTDHQDIYHQTETAGKLLDRSLRLAQDIEVKRAPSALAGLRSMLSQTSLAYLEATRIAADWVGAPTAQQELIARQSIEAARELLEQVEGSRWLEEAAEPGNEPGPGDSTETREDAGW